MNISHAEDALLSAMAVWEEFLQEFESEWYRPYGQMQVGMAVKAMSPEMIRQIDPVIAGQVAAALGV